MTAKKKLDLVVAQYAEVARHATRVADSLSSMAKLLDETKAEKVLKTLEAEGLIDAEGVLTAGAKAPVSFN